MPACTSSRPVTAQTTPSPRSMRTPRPDAAPTGRCSSPPMPTRDAMRTGIAPTSKRQPTPTVPGVSTPAAPSRCLPQPRRAPTSSASEASATSHEIEHRRQLADLAGDRLRLPSSAPACGPSAHRPGSCSSSMSCCRCDTTTPEFVAQIKASGGELRAGRAADRKLLRPGRQGAPTRRPPRASSTSLPASGLRPSGKSSSVRDGCVRIMDAAGR